MRIRYSLISISVPRGNELHESTPVSRLRRLLRRLLRAGLVTFKLRPRGLRANAPYMKDVARAFGLTSRDLGEAMCGVGELSPFFSESQSDIGQELLAYLASGRKMAGFFVEARACDGVFSSNSLVLEQHFGWQGLLVEPGKVWKERLTANRSSRIDTRALNSHAGLAVFREESESNLSLLVNQSLTTGFEPQTYSVMSVPLQQILREIDAPTYIDFLSLDVEGSELAILQAFDFEQYTFGVMCIEHVARYPLHALESLLDPFGYCRLKQLERTSNGDIWFMRKALANELGFS